MTKFLSRKFLLALGAFITLLAEERYPEALGVVLAYLAAEGFIDARKPRL